MKKFLFLNDIHYKKGINEKIYDKNIFQHLIQIFKKKKNFELI